MLLTNELIEPRPGEKLDAARLEPFLRQRLPVADGSFEIAQFVGGHANLTYLVRFGKTEYVLRRPPRGPLPKGAHDMGREHRVLSGLYREYPLAPRSYAFCDDETIIGAPFVVVERRRGIVIRGDMPAELDPGPETNRRMGEMIIDNLAGLHLASPRAAGFDDPDRGRGFRQRQMEGWARRWRAAHPDTHPVAEQVIAYLADRVPPEQPVSLLHNDYKLDNILLDPGDLARATAVLDWDMCAVGDPLLDLGYVLNYWSEPGDPDAWVAAATMPTMRAGFPDRRQAVARYARRTGFDVARLEWYRVFAAFKLAAILQQIYARYRRGETSDRRFAVFGERISGLLDKAATLVVEKDPLQ